MSLEIVKLFLLGGLLLIHRGPQADMSLEIAKLFLLGGLLIIDTDVIKEWEVLLPTKQRPPYVGKVFAYVTFHCFTGVLGATLLLLLLLVRQGLAKEYVL